MFLLLEKLFLVHSEDAEVSWCFHGWRLERFRVSMMLEGFVTLSEDDDVHWCFDGYGSGCFCR